MKIAIIFGHYYGKRGFSKRQFKRMDKGIELFNKGEIDLIIITGGKGRFNYSNLPLGEMGRKYLRKYIPDSHIVTENHSVNTKENIINSMTIIEKMNKNIEKVVFVSSYPHILRVKKLCNKLVVDELKKEFVVSDYVVDIKTTVWDLLWECGGWTKLILNIN